MRFSTKKTFNDMNIALIEEKLKQLKS
jgi:hypothetical protein